MFNSLSRFGNARMKDSVYRGMPPKYQQNVEENELV
jgi:hypothetical protein